MNNTKEARAEKIGLQEDSTSSLSKINIHSEIKSPVNEHKRTLNQQKHSSQKNTDSSGPFSPVDKLYQEFIANFGNTSPNQLFSLVWPGTVLAPDSFVDSNPEGPVPVLTSVAQSLLFDQYYPISTITQPDGTRVSDRYQQSIERYGPVPNAAISQLQSLLRDRLRQTTQILIDGKTVTMTLMDEFNYLHGIWTSKRQTWDDIQANKLAQLQSLGDPNYFANFILWYETQAQPYLDGINAAYDRLIAEFPLSAFQDALAVLNTQEGAALLRARNDLTNSTIAVPPQLGNQFVISQAIPADWGSILTPSTIFLDLLASPSAQYAKLQQAIRVLEQQVYAWQALLAQIPAGSAEQIAAALNAFEEAASNYNATINTLLADYSNNAILAVQIYMDSEDDELTEINTVLENLDDRDGEPFKKLEDSDVQKIISQIGAAQNQLIGDNASMVSAGIALGQSATTLLNSKAGSNIKAILLQTINQLSNQIADLQITMGQLGASNVRARQVAVSVKNNNSNNKNANANDSIMPNSSLDQRWTQVTMSIDKSSMDTSSSTSTSFSQMDWGVDLFFGSAGGESSSSSSSFASQYMNGNYSIDIGMLATKVLIQRPWLHSELFNLSSNYYRVSNVPLTTPSPPTGGWVRSALVPETLGGAVSASQAQSNAAEINKGPFPGYPLALLIVKDVTIKITYDSTQTKAFEHQAQSNSSQGGGFFCFSASSVDSSSSSTQSSSGYSMAGTYTFRIPAPQVVGTWLQITPTDESQPLDNDLAQEIADSIGFVTRLKAVASAGVAVNSPPKAPALM